MALMTVTKNEETTSFLGNRSQDLARFYRGLGDPTRLKILKLLSTGEKSVSSLVDQLKSPQGRVSSHLACLRWCGFVVSERRGRSVYYTIIDPKVISLLNLGEEIFGTVNERIISCQMLDGETTT
jgi:DNA-binding transcriptional ArsR family regulator